MYRKRKVEKRPSLEELLEMKKSMSVVAIGKKYKVSDTTIRKWIKSYKKNYTRAENRTRNSA